MSVLSFTLLFTCIIAVSCQDLNILVGDMLPAIHQLNLRDLSRSAFNILNISRPIAIDFDAGTNDMYWTDVQLHQIWTRNLGTSETKVLLTLNTSSVLDGLALDADRRKLFYTDSGNDVIGTISTDGSGNEVILDSGHDQPRAIVLDEEKRLMYWTDWGTSAFIASASYDGTNVTKIVTTGVLWPNGLTLDKMNNVLYWCDAKTNKIEAVNVDGSGRRLVLTEPLAHYFDIFYHDEALFYTDWNRRGILNIPARGGSVGAISSDPFLKLTGIHVTSTMDFSDCQLGQYGAGCDECGHCKEDSVCDKTTGICLAGCSAGYMGRQCVEECSYGTYGRDCAGTCEGCTRGCDHITGVCYPPKSPNEASTEDPSSRNDDDSLNASHIILIGAVAGGVVVLLVIVLVIIVVVVVLLKRKRAVPNQGTERDYATLGVNRPPIPYSVAADLPPAYASIEDIKASEAGYSHLSGADNSDYAFIQQPTPGPCGGANTCTYLSVSDESSGKNFSAVY